MANHLKDLKPWFCNGLSREHGRGTIKEQLRNVENGTRDELLCLNNCVGKEVGVPLIFTNHPHFNGLIK